MMKLFLISATLALTIPRAVEGRSVRGVRRNGDGDAIEPLIREEPDSGGNQPNHRKKALVIDLRGPTRGTGDGLRLMAMVMDLVKASCEGEEGYAVDILSDATAGDELVSGWSPQIAKHYFAGTRFFGMKELKAGEVQFGSYQTILIGFKLDLLRTYAAPKSVVSETIEMFQAHPDMNRGRVSIVWDDVPFERCQIRPQAAWVCSQMPSLVANLSAISSRFYMITDLDRQTMGEHMAKHGIERTGNFDVWPMRIQNMAELLPDERFTKVPDDSVVFANSAYQEKNLVIMLGNGHPGNLKAVQSLFRSGAISEICRAIIDYKSNIKLMFLGGIAQFVQAEVEALDAKDMVCVNVTQGYVDDAQLDHEILPKTRSILNPLFEDLHSGISVKNFEALMSGTPTITTAHGLHGLGELPGCEGLLMPDPNAPEDFASFFVHNIVEDLGYQRFVEAFQIFASRCVGSQEAQLRQSHLGLCSGKPA